MLILPSVVVALAALCPIRPAELGAAASREDGQDRSRALARSVSAGDPTVRPEPRQTYADFWKSLPPHKFIMVQSLTTGALKASGSGAQTATVECSGIGWIGRNGQPRSIGKLVIK
jgi:hypothetical protein